MSSRTGIRLNCPTCKHPLAADLDMPANEVSCPKCHEVSTISPSEPIPAAVADSSPREQVERWAVPSAPSLSANPTSPPPRRSQGRGLIGAWQATSKSFKVLAIGGLLFLALAGVPVFSALSGVGMNNAECGRCGHRFHISDEYRNNSSPNVVKIPCPRCGIESEPDSLFKHYENSLWDPTKH